MSPSTYRRVTMVALVLLVAIVVTGAGVRLTGSGLGCTDWPACTDRSFTPSDDLNSKIEFYNRLVTGLVGLAVIGAVLGSLVRTPRRRDLTWLSLGLVAGVIGLGLHFAVYNSELIQTAIVAVDKGQMEAARTLGLSRGQALRKVVIPQAVRDVIPPIGNNMIALLKDSALVSVIGVSELTLSAQLAIGRTYRPFEFYLVAAVVYYIINLGMEYVLRKIERRIALSR